MSQGRQRNRFNAILFTVSCVIIIVGLFLIPYVIDYYLSPDELIRNTTQALETLTGAAIKIGDAQLSILEGITFTDVRVLVPEAKLKLDPAFTPDDAVLLKADRFHITLRRRGFLGLRFRIGDITIDNPQLHLTHHEARQRWNWQMLFAGPASGPVRKRTFGLGPPITLHSGQITFTRIQSDRRVTLRKINFGAQAVPNLQDQFYRLTLNTWTPRTKGPTLTLDFSPRAGAVLAGTLEALSLKDLTETLPEPYAACFRRLHLAGNVSVAEAEYRHEERTKLILVLDNVRARLPLSRAEYDHPQGKTLLQLSEVSGRIILTRSEIIIPRLDAKLNGVACRISGKYRGYSTHLDNVSFDLHVAATGFPCPDYTNPPERDYLEAYLPWKLCCFFRDFKPRGKLDLNLMISKPRGLNAPLTLAGQVRPRGVSAEYYKFPYRLDNLTGSVRLADGGFELIGLTGFSAGGKAVINGTISEPSKFAKIDLAITTSRTPLDPKLFHALPAPYRAIWKKFDLAGAADAQIELHQAYGPDQPWQTRITAALLDVSGTYQGFKYPLRNMTGVLQFENGVLELCNVTGRNGAAHVTLNGKVQRLETPQPELDLALKADGVAIDRPLMDLIPGPPGRILRDGQLAGTADLTGTIKTAPGRAMDYRLDCRLRDADFRYKDFPYPLTNLAARLAIAPDRAVITDLKAHRGDQTISGQGTVAFTADNRIALTVHAENLNVDPLLYSALDPTQKATWDLVKPVGKIGVLARLERTRNDPWKWDLAITLQKAAFQYKNLSRVTDLEGQILFTPRQAVLKNLSGKVLPRGTVRADGAITTVDNKTLVHLSRLNVAGLEVTDDFLALLDHAGLARKLGWTPGGAFDCTLDTLGAELAPERRQTWELAGKLAFKDVNVEALDRVPTAFEYSGNLFWGTADNALAVTGRLALDSFNWANRRIRDIRANLTKKINDPVLLVNHIKARYAGGEISGQGNLTFDANQRVFGLQLTLENVDAATALRLDKQSGNIRGQMRGELYMRGALGEKYVRQGGGTLQIIEAEALKVPLMAQIYQSANPNRPANLAAFHDITINFILEKHKVNLHRLELVSPALSLVGAGTINLSNDRLSLDLFAAAPKNVEQLPILTDLWKGAASQITELEVRGPVAHPTISARPLSGISQTLQSLLDAKGR